MRAFKKSGSAFSYRIVSERGPLQKCAFRVDETKRMFVCTREHRILCTCCTLGGHFWGHSLVFPAFRCIPHIPLIPRIPPVSPRTSCIPRIPYSHYFLGMMRWIRFIKSTIFLVHLRKHFLIIFKNTRPIWNSISLRSKELAL